MLLGIEEGHKMRILKVLFIIIALFCLLCSCAKGDEDIEMYLSPQDKSLGELSTQIYNETELATIASFVGSIQELDAKYHIECIRKAPTGYRVSYCGKTNLTLLLFDDLGQIIMGSVYKMSKCKSYFDTLSIGKSLEDVMELDSDGNYLFLYTGRNDIPRKSTHYTMDGYLITIEYDDENFISNIQIELI